MLAPGDRLGQYELRERLGQGGMATVFRAYQPSLDREVAIKVLSVVGAPPSFLERFRREARSISRLRHPNILWVFDFGEQDGLAYMVGELVPGGTLADRLGRPLPLEWVGVRLVALASALDYAHANGIVHRDVKPSNVLMTAEDSPVLSDFGIARMLEDTGGLTAAGTVMGTPEYMSPEQAQGLEVGPASDQYSLAVMLYELLCGRPPFRAPTPVAVAMAHVYEPPPRPRELNPALPPAVEAVVLRALAKDPAERWGSAGELAGAYAQAIGVDIRDLAQQAAVTPPAVPRIGGPTRTGTPPPITPQRMPTPPAWAPPVEPGRVGPAAAVRPAAAGARPRAAPPARRRGFPVILAAAALTILAIGVAAFLVRPQGPLQPGGPTPAAGKPAGEASRATATATPAVLALATPTRAAPTPTSVPTPAPTATAELRIAPTPTSGPVAMTIASPAPGAVVPPRFVLRGLRTGRQTESQHIWVLAGPVGGDRKWWPYQQEIVPDTAGNWRAEIDLGGEAGIAHELVVGLTGQAGHAAIRRQIAEKPGEPFEGGFPPDFARLASVVVVRGP